MRKDKQKKENSLLSLLPLAEVFLVGAVAFVLLAVFVVIFLFGLFLARALVRMTRAVNHVPLIGGINRLAGFLLGLVYALLIGYVFSMAALLLSGALGDRVPLLRTSALSLMR